MPIGPTPYGISEAGEFGYQEAEYDSSLRFILPVGRSGYAIAAGYLGLFSLIVFPAPLALLFGILAVGDIRRHPKKLGMGRAVSASPPAASVAWRYCSFSGRCFSRANA